MFIDCVNLKLTKLIDMHAFVSIMVAFFFTYPGIVITNRYLYNILRSRDTWACILRFAFVDCLIKRQILFNGTS